MQSSPCLHAVWHVRARDPYELVQPMLQGVRCIRAPGEGEAMCAALTAAGLADMAATRDVIDALMFGARAVISPAQSASGTKAKPLFGAPNMPSDSGFKVTRRSGVAAYFGVRVCIHLRVLCLCFATRGGSPPSNDPVSCASDVQVLLIQDRERPSFADTRQGI